MISDWTSLTIGDLCDKFGGELQTGPFGSQLHAHDYIDAGEVPVIPTSGIGRRRLQCDGIPKIAREKADDLSQHYLRSGDILFARRGVQAAGLSALVEDEHEGWLCGTGAIRLRIPGVTIDPVFLSFSLADARAYEWIRRHAIGATMPNLNEGIVRSIPVAIPPLYEQRRIAAVLGSLDDKIELNRKMNRTLEEMAQTLFKAWFIDFDGHDDLVDSELGPIPKGWKIEPLDQVAHYLNGAACQKYPAEDGAESLPVVKIRELNQGITGNTDRASLSIPKKWWVKNGDVLFSWSGSLVVKIWTGGEGALNQHLFNVTSSRFPRWFYYLWTKHHLGEFQQIAADKATTMGHIKRHHLTDAKCYIPPTADLARYGSILGPIIDRQIGNDLESQTLTELRDTLLPKLISGELRIPEAEALL